MRLTLMLPGALIPSLLATELGSALQLPELSRLVARSAQAGAWPASAQDPVPEDRWLAREVFGAHPPAPTAPYAWTELTGQRETSRTVWRADPVHVEIGRETLIVQPLHGAPLSEPEADSLLSAANEICRAEHCELQRFGSEWFLLSARAWSLRAQPLTAMTGEPLPVPDMNSTDALHWSRLQNAIQMRWHVHPVNEAREANGLPSANGLWLHGGGQWKPLAHLPWSRIHTNRADLRGAARAAGVQTAPDTAIPDNDALLVWDDAVLPRMNADWSAWLEAMARMDRRLAALPVAEIDFVLAGRQRLSLWHSRPADRFRLWRRQTLAEVLSE